MKHLLDSSDVFNGFYILTHLILTIQYNFVHAHAHEGLIIIIAINTLDQIDIYIMLKIYSYVQNYISIIL